MRFTLASDPRSDWADALEAALARAAKTSQAMEIRVVCITAATATKSFDGSGAKDGEQRRDFDKTIEAGSRQTRSYPRRANTRVFPALSNATISYLSTVPVSMPGEP